MVVKQRSVCPHVKLPDLFSLSTTEKHFSNIEESLKLIEEIIAPHVGKECDMLNLEDFPTLLITDVFQVKWQIFLSKCWQIIVSRLCQNISKHD